VNVPLKWFLSKEYARTRYSQIEETAKRYSYGDPGLVNEGKNTTHVSAMDDEGNMVATTQTLNGGFGSMITVPSNGILLNNCMALFDPRPGKANSIAGGKRMLSSMSPTIILRNSEPYFCLGTPGGLQIFPSVAQAIVNVIDHKMSIQEAVEAPRIWTMGINNTPGEKLLVEKDLSKKICDSLISMGHDLLKLPIVAGGMNGVLRDPQTGMLHGGACWRADGTPMGVSGGRAHPKAFEPDPLF
jgi:gamma-glutamyltranspeptidase/glutathione hydrolase